MNENKKFEVGQRVRVIGNKYKFHYHAIGSIGVIDSTAGECIDVNVNDIGQYIHPDDIEPYDAPIATEKKSDAPLRVEEMPVVNGETVTVTRDRYERDIDDRNNLRARNSKLVEACRRAEIKLRAYVGVCTDDKELTDVLLPMLDEVIVMKGGAA